MSLYSCLLGLREAGPDEELLERALRVALDEIGAETGHLGVYRGAAGSDPVWQLSVGRNGDEGHAGKLSRTIIHDVLEKGEPQSIPSALGHPIYRLRESVRGLEIRSVLCAPVGEGPRGVLYAQGRPLGTFQAQHERFFFGLAQLLSPVVERVYQRVVEGAVPGAAEGAFRAGGEPMHDGPRWLRPLAPDDIRPWREAKNTFRRHYITWALKAFDGNKTATAKALELARARFYALLKELELDE